MMPMHVGLLVVLDCAHQAGVTSHRGTTLDGRDSKIDMPVIDTVEAAQQRMIHWLADVSQGTDAFPVLVRRPAHACRLYSKRACARRSRTLTAQSRRCSPIREHLR